ncbi:hypothetical protein BCR32DRAFT_289289 [Anaeromyces robustus]|uniref:Uncharacterized protein n=1 Tax=Anaeromyces robustus TaxID=1754192 RepID=A0A1Y1XPM0_9FUNG|nr:hypothetical protein BCR32DRAFT_289289 [Anaeromyces robustus]|eukprot:ORX87466.1 hypothetical protein BCR32DRAFT_289289 [Anaeromyces robustus]
MDEIKLILISKLHLKLPISRKNQLEHLTQPYTNDQISSIQEENDMNRNLITLQYYLDMICYGYSIYLTKWQCSSWFNIFKTTHDKFIEFINGNNNDPSTYKSHCLNIFKNELFYYCNPRTVTLYLKECENNKTKENNTDLSFDNDNLEEVLLSNRYVKPGIFDSILPPLSKSEEQNTELSSLSLNKSNILNTSINSQSLKNINNNSYNNKDQVKISNNTLNSNNSISSNKYSKNEENINNSNTNIIKDESESIINDEGDNSEIEFEEDDDENKDLYIFEYNIPRTFNSLQIENLARFFLKTYIQHINIIAYVFSKPQGNIITNYKKSIVIPPSFEELEHGILAEEWPNWVQEQENIIIKKKKEEEAAIELERKKNEERLLKEKELLEEELAKQKLSETQNSIINNLISILYQPSNKNISEFPVIPLIKQIEEKEEKSNENENIVNTSPVENKEEHEENNSETNLNNNDNDDDFNTKLFKISNPNFRKSFLDLWKKQVSDREQQQKDLVYQLNFELQRKNDSLQFDLSEQSLLKLENSRQELMKKIKEITGEDESKKLKYVYDPNQVETIIQNSELLKEQYFTQLQKYIEEIITTNIQHINERIENVNNELEKLRGNKEEKTNTNKKGGKDDKKTTNNNKAPSKKEDNKKAKANTKKK